MRRGRGSHRQTSAAFQDTVADKFMAQWLVDVQRLALGLDEGHRRSNLELDRFEDDFFHALKEKLDLHSSLLSQPTAQVDPIIKQDEKEQQQQQEEEEQEEQEEQQEEEKDGHRGQSANTQVITLTTDAASTIGKRTSRPERATRRALVKGDDDIDDEEDGMVVDNVDVEERYRYLHHDLALDLGKDPMEGAREYLFSTPALQAIVRELQQKFASRAKSTKLSPRAKAVLSSWWVQNFAWPYPSETEKVELAHAAK